MNKDVGDGGMEADDMVGVQSKVYKAISIELAATLAKHKRVNSPSFDATSPGPKLYRVMMSRQAGLWIKSRLV